MQFLNLKTNISCSPSSSDYLCLANTDNRAGNAMEVTRICKLCFGFCYKISLLLYGNDPSTKIFLFKVCNAYCVPFKACSVLRSIRLHFELLYQDGEMNQGWVWREACWDIWQGRGFVKGSPLQQSCHSECAQNTPKGHKQCVRILSLHVSLTLVEVMLPACPHPNPSSPGATPVVNTTSNSDQRNVSLNPS